MTAILEQYANDAADTLNGSINNSTTTVVVNSAAAFPAAGNFRIKIDSEIMLVTAVSSNTFTVATRGTIDGTSAGSHTSGAAVTHVLTAASLQQLISDSTNAGAIGSRQAAGLPGRLWLPDSGLQIMRDNGTSWDGYGPVYKMAAPPVVSSFTWDNQGSATATDQDGTIYMTSPNTNGVSHHILYKSAPATPYTITALFDTWCNVYSTAAGVELVFRESSSGKCSVFRFGSPGNAPTPHWIGDHLTDSTHLSTTFVTDTQVQYGYGTPFFLRITDDGTNRTMSFSMDGINFFQASSETRTTFLTADQIGMGLYVNASTSTTFYATLLSWKQS